MKGKDVFRNVLQEVTGKRVLIALETAVLVSSAWRFRQEPTVRNAIRVTGNALFLTASAIPQQRPELADA